VPALATRADQRELLVGAYHLTRALDMTRPVISNDGWEHIKSDIWGVHDYTSVPAELVNRYGGVSLVSGGDGLWHGYDDVRTPDELAKRLSALFSAVHQCKGLAGFCYTQFADTEQESNGLVSAERQPKLSPGVVRRMVQGEDS